MKIIKTGEWKKRITCKGCQSVLEVVKEDIQVKEVPVDEEFAIQHYIECPVCSQIIIQSSIPKKVAELIQQLKS